MLYTESYKCFVIIAENNIPLLPSIGQIFLLFHEELAPVIHDIISCSIKECRFPKLYKHAPLTLIPKANCRNDIDDDFRQVSILRHIIKLSQKFQLLLHKPYILPNTIQHGFTQNHPAVSALRVLSQNWFNATDNTEDERSEEHALFLGFRKVFDLVDHGIPVTKLAEFNINKSFWLWAKRFLEETNNRLKVLNVGQ